MSKPYRIVVVPSMKKEAEINEEVLDFEYIDCPSSATMQEEKEEDIPTEEQPAKMIWTNELVEELLNKLEENIDDFRDKIRRSLLWRKIWKELREVCPFATLEQVQRKWRNLLLAVRRYDQSRTSKSQGKIWKPRFYDRVHYIFERSCEEVFITTRKSPMVMKEKNVISGVHDDSFKSYCITRSDDLQKTSCIIMSDTGSSLKSSSVSARKADTSPSSRENSKEIIISDKSMISTNSITTTPSIRMLKDKNVVLLKRPRLSESDTDESIESTDIALPDGETSANDDGNCKRDQAKVQNGEGIVKINMLPRLKNMPQSSKSEAVQILNSINEKLEKIITSKDKQQLQFEELLELSRERNKMLAEKNKLLKDLRDSINKNDEQR